MRLIVTGGGTGGHIYPALSIADKYKEKYEDIEILYVGVENGLESKIVPQYGYDFRGIKVKGFQRKISIENVKRVIMALKATGRAKKIISDFKPDLVIGTGGYVCGPMVMAACKKKVPTAIHEQNAFPGITNKILSKKADRVFLGFEAAKERLNCKNDAIVVGNPVRKEIRNSISKEEARLKLNLPIEGKFIIVTGGSGGFEAINNSFIKIIPELLEHNIGFVFSTGKNYYSAIQKKLKEMNIKTGDNQRVFEYIEDMPSYLAASDLCIVSAGATTIAEINAIGRASIIIPKAYTAENHQEYNAKYVKSKNAGEYILEKELEETILFEKIMNILGDEEVRIDMENNSKSLNLEDPCEIIVSEMGKLVRK
ncbi:MAG: undecaprenyldiphospho-muramoylpentapeptide beta-N-acetylglucosaminyltransferase [Proteocatella sp.]